jgi:cell shape-determining protein MreC
MLRRGTFPLLLIISLGHVLVISAQVQSKSGIPLIEAAAFGMFSRFQQTTTGVTDGVKSGWNQYFALRGVEQENGQLRNRVIELEAQLQQEQAQAAKARSLEEALKLQPSIAAPTLAARVIAGNPQPGSLQVMIDRGSAVSSVHSRHTPRGCSSSSDGTRRPARCSRRAEWAVSSWAVRKIRRSGSSTFRISST